MDWRSSFFAFIHSNSKPYLFTAIKVGSSSLLKPRTIKTEILLLWHEATITLHFNVGLWYMVLSRILLRKFIWNSIVTSGIRICVSVDFSRTYDNGG